MTYQTHAFNSSRFTLGSPLNQQTLPNMTNMPSTHNNDTYSNVRFLIFIGFKHCAMKRYEIT